MKKVLLLMLLVVMTMSAAAQTVYGSFRDLNKTSRVMISFDFSSALIHSMPEADFAQYEPDWTPSKQEILTALIGEAQEELNNRLYLTTADVPGYKLVVKVLNISVKGDFFCDLYLFNPNGQEIGRIVNLYGAGGRVGSKINLIKDGATEVGESIGYRIRKAMKSRGRSYAKYNDEVYR